MEKMILYDWLEIFNLWFSRVAGFRFLSLIRFYE